MSRNGTRLPQLIPDRVRAASHRLHSRVWKQEPIQLSVTGSSILQTLPAHPSAERCEFVPVRPREEFGNPGSAFEYRLFKVHVPEAPSAGERHLFWDCDGEATVYLDGQPWAGIDVAHRYCTVPEGALDLVITVGTYQQGIWVGPALPLDSRCRFRNAYTATRDQEAWDLYWDFEILRQLMDAYLQRISGSTRDGEGFHPPLRRAPVALRKLLSRLDSACDAIDTDELVRVRGLLRDTYEEFAGSAADGEVALVGHSHLDLVWLWPERVTYEKIVHTTATTVRLMERYPELIYSQSTPLLYHELETRSPSLMSRVRELMREGRWEATGGLCVEADVNIPAGEGLARSLLFGQREFEKMTGSPSSTLWLPDVFGYPGCLPQLMQLSGIDSFFTTKLSWSAITNFPYNAFNWRSADGSQVLAFLSPVGYCDPVTVETVTRCAEHNQQTGVHDTVLMPVGYGDGGGGITEEMIESARRLRSLAGVPAVSWTNAEDFFAGMAPVAGDLPVFEGELYLEFHRGTLTTQGRYKSLYRACERAMQLREAARACAGLGPLSLEEWRRLLFGQFHDALPGSSIRVVYDELEPELARLREEAVALTDSELSSVMEPGAENDGGSPRGRWVFNPIAMPRTVVVDGPDGDHDAGVARCSGLGLFPLLSVDEHSCGFREVSARVLDNGLTRAEFSEGGSLVNLSVRGQPLCIRESGFQLCRDYPAKYDAWDIDYAATELGQAVLEDLELSIVEQSPARAVLEGNGEIGDGSHVTVRYILPLDSEHLRVELDINWAETHRLLQFVARTSYQGRDAIFGEPFGSVSRSQKPELPATSAQWEVAGQRWAAVCNDSRSEGLAIVAESKYGFSCEDGELRISLLRATVDPDPEADRGSHLIRFAVGAFRATTDGQSLSTAAAAEALYADFAVVHGKPAAGSGVCGDAPAIRFGVLGSLTPSWVKPAEDGSGVIVRLHECAGNEGNAVMNLNPGLVGESPPRVIPVDLLERPIPGAQPLLSGDGPALEYRVPYLPYQIITLKILAD